MSTPSVSVIDSLRARFNGELIMAGDNGYDQARSLWNGDIDRRPFLIARGTNADDIGAAVRFGRDYDLEIAVRGGGHSFAGHGAVDDGLMIDLSAMRDVTVDPLARRARCARTRRERARAAVTKGAP